MMNFPLSGGGSDDAQFFFEDYNYYYHPQESHGGDGAAGRSNVIGHASVGGVGDHVIAMASTTATNGVEGGRQSAINADLTLNAINGEAGDGSSMNGDRMVQNGLDNGQGIQTGAVDVVNRTIQPQNSTTIQQNNLIATHQQQQRMDFADHMNQSVVTSLLSPAANNQQTMRTFWNQRDGPTMMVETNPSHRVQQGAQSVIVMHNGHRVVANGIEMVSSNGQHNGQSNGDYQHHDDYSTNFDETSQFENGHHQHHDDQHTRQRSFSSSTSVGGDEKHRSNSGGSKSSKFSSSKLCRVCGDKALGYNFNVVTCESCKAFFRRNALKKKKLQCPFQNRCTITVASRRYCQKCRLRKCFEVGMKAEYIMTEEQRAQKRQRLLERESLEKNGKSSSLDSSSQQFMDEYFIDSAEDEATTMEPTKETRNRYDSFSSVHDVKPVVVKRSSKSSSASSSVTYQPDAIVQTNGSSPTVDVSDWIDQPVLHQNLSPSMADLGSPTLDCNDDESITIRLPRSTLQSILYNTSLDRTQQINTLGRAVLAAARSNASLVNPIVISNRLPSICVCPCACGSVDPSASTVATTTTNSAVVTTSNSSIDQLSMNNNNQSIYSGSMSGMDVDQWGLTAESQMAYGDQFSLFPIQEEQCSPPLISSVANAVPTAADPSQLPLSTLTVADSQISNHARPSAGVYEEQPNNDEASMYASEPGPAPVRPSASMEFDLDILQTITSAFDVDWQIPSLPFAPFPSELFNNNTSRHERLDELISANNEEWNQYPKALCSTNMSAADFTAQDIYNLVSHALRCVIKQHKRLNAMKLLPIEDQYFLFKAAARELCIFRAVMNYDTKTDMVRIQYPGRESTALEIAKRIRGGLYNEYKQMIGCFPESWRRDEPLMLIVSALILFNPNIPQLTNRVGVESSRHAYLQLLKEYLESTQTTEEVTKTYDYLLEYVRQIKPWCENYGLRVYFELEPNNLEPTVVQVYDFH